MLCPQPVENYFGLKFVGIKALVTVEKMLVILKDSSDPIVTKIVSTPPQLRNDNTNVVAQ